jgi:hypothetical protein
MMLYIVLIAVIVPIIIKIQVVAKLEQTVGVPVPPVNVAKLTAARIIILAAAAQAPTI